MSYARPFNLFSIKSVTTVWLFMFLVLFTAPLFPGRDTLGFYSVEWSFFFIAAIAIYLIVIMKLKNGSFILRTDPFYYLVGLFLTLALISIVDAPNRIRGLLYIGQYIPFFFVVVVIINVVNSERKLEKVVDMMIYLGLIYSLIVILSAFTLRERRSVDLFLINNFNIGVIKALLFWEVPFIILLVKAINEKITPGRITAIAAMTFAVMLTGSRGSILMLMIISVLVFLIARKTKRAAWVALTLLVMVAVGLSYSPYTVKRLELLVVKSRADFEDKITSFSRLYTAMVATELMKNHPINGVGIGNSVYFVKSKMDELGYKIPDAVMEFWEERRPFQTTAMPLKLGSELGILGFIYFFVFYYYLYKRVSKAYLRASNIRLKNILCGCKIAIIAALLHNFITPAYTNYYSWFYYGVMVAASRIGFSEESRRNE